MVWIYLQEKELKNQYAVKMLVSKEWYINVYDK